MMKIIASVKAWLREKNAARKERSEAKAMGRLLYESRERIQVMEFAGGLFVSFDGMPLVPTTALTDTVPNVLDAVRGVYMEWYGRRVNK